MISRRTLQISLGLLWLLDAALQFQPFMFGDGFARDVVAPAGAGQPGIVAHPVHWAAQVVLSHPVLTNAGFALVQAILGVGLLYRRSARLALSASIVWGVAVWWLGEGLGGLTTGETLLTGAPGAALLYVVIALFAYPDPTGRSDSRPSRWAIPAWSALWLMGAGLQLAAGNNTGGSLAAMFRDARGDNRGWIGAIDGHLANVHYSNDVAAGLIALEILIAMWALIPGAVQRMSLAVGAAAAGGIWLVVQGLGDLTSGQATDPNSGPLIVLLAAAAYGAATSGAGRERRNSWTETGRRRFAVLGVAAALGAIIPGVANAADQKRQVRHPPLGVVESDYRIALNTHTETAGTYSIVDKNESRQEHGLVFNGPGLRKKLLFYVPAHATKAATITLRRGTYDIYCPIPGHKMLGMNTRLTVR